MTSNAVHSLNITDIIAATQKQEIKMGLLSPFVLSHSHQEASCDWNCCQLQPERGYNQRHPNEFKMHQGWAHTKLNKCRWWSCHSICHWKIISIQSGKCWLNAPRRQWICFIGFTNSKSWGKEEVRAPAAPDQNRQTTSWLAAAAPGRTHQQQKIMVLNGPEHLLSPPTAWQCSHKKEWSVWNM